MFRQSILLLLLPACLWLFLACKAAAPTSAYDLDNPTDNMNAFAALRGDRSGKDVMFHFSGPVYSFVPGESRRHLFNLEGINVGRLVPHEDGWRLLTREVAVFRDPETGAILDTWTNPWTGETLPVIHIWNTPVNQELTLNGRWKMFPIPVNRMNDTLFWRFEIFLRYPSPLPTDQYPEASSGDMYEAAEMFQFLCEASDLEDPGLTSIPCRLTWTRISPWMPFMKMGTRPGTLVFHCSGAKWSGTFDDLPPDFVALVDRKHPEYRHAPKHDSWGTPNVTSWTYYRSLFPPDNTPH